MPSLAHTLTELAEMGGSELDPKVARVLMRAFTELHDELSDQVKRVDFLDLKTVVKELAEAQQRTEQRLEELIEAQKRTEQRVERLAEAQSRTEETVRMLVKDMAHVKTELGGLSHSVGYGLENLAYRTLPALLAERHNITVSEPLHRVWLDGVRQPLEVNIWGLGSREDGAVVRILGEAKTRLSAAKHFKGVERMLTRTRRHWGTEEVLVVLVTHMALPGTVEEAARRGWLVFQSFELEH